MKFSREAKLGLLGTLTLFLFIWGLSYLKGKDLFSRQITLITEYDNVSGLVETNPVVVSGVKIGQVQKITFHPDGSGRIMVSLILNKDIAIPKNSVAHLKGGDFMGFREIELLLGDAPERVSNGDTLISKTSSSLMEDVGQQFGPLKQQAEGLLLSIDSVLTAINFVFNEDTRKNLSLSIESMKNTMVTVDQQSNRLAAIMANAESITANLKDNNQTITNILQNFSTISDTLAALELGRTMAEVNSTMEALSLTIGKIQRGEGSMGLLVNDEELYRNLETTSRNLDLLLEDIRKNPRRYINVSVFGKN
ncbi:MAG: MlaD family protein [Bacteroidales bacterium]|nr:MlaD family protein [Bacteroidales bacterium]NLM91640.1 MCE family protein [Bacteroidales bacterium]